MVRFVLMSFVVVCLSAWAALGADEKQPASANGAWVPSSAEMAGAPFPDEVRKSIKLVIKDDKYEVTVGGQPDKGTVKFDAAAKPATIDITGVEGPNKGKTILAIYELKGDTMKVCYDLSGKAGQPSLPASREPLCSS